jgi:hypothetical protein
MQPSVATVAGEIQTPRPEQIVEVESFVEFLRLRGGDRSLMRASPRLAIPNLKLCGRIRKSTFMTHFSFGDIVLVWFPFTNQTSYKLAEV